MKDRDNRIILNKLADVLEELMIYIEPDVDIFFDGEEIYSGPMHPDEIRQE